MPFGLFKGFTGSGPFNISYEIRGTNRVQNQLRALASFYPEKTDPILKEHGEAEVAFLKAKPYPAKLPNQVYIRTFKLQRGWSLTREKAAVYSIENTVFYAGWVVKKGWQNRQYHEGRWWTADDVLKSRMPKLTQALTAELKALANRG